MVGIQLRGMEASLVPMKMGFEAVTFPSTCAPRYLFSPPRRPTQVRYVAVAPRVPVLVKYACRGYEEYGPQASIPGWLVTLVMVPSTTLPLPFPPLFSHPLAKCTNNQHLPSRQLPLNELAKHQTRNICRLIATGVINLVQLSKPLKEGFEMSQDVPILLVPLPFLGTANNCESRCSIKLPAGSWLASSASLPPFIWQKSPGHLSPSPSSRSARRSRNRLSDNVSGGGGGVEFPSLR